MKGVNHSKGVMDNSYRIHSQVGDPFPLSFALLPSIPARFSQTACEPERRPRRRLDFLPDWICPDENSTGQSFRNDEDSTARRATLP